MTDTGVDPRPPHPAPPAEPGSAAAPTRRTFLDPTLEAEFTELGYVVVPLLSAEEVDDLNQIFDRSHPTADEGFATDFERTEPARRAEITRAVAPSWDAHLPGLLDDYRVFMTSFLAKWPDAGSALAPHQDWSYVDERQYRSAAIWVALTDVGPDLANGPLCVLPGSHRLADTWRGPATERWFAPWSETIEQHALALTVPAGQAVLIDARLVHWSPPNQSRRVRLALAGATVPREAPLLFVVDEPAGQVRIVTGDDDLFAESGPAQLATSRHVDRTVIEVTDRVARPADIGAVAACLGAPVAAQPGEALGGSEPPDGSGSPVERLVVSALRFGFSMVGQVDPSASQPFPDRAAYPWLADLEADWARLRDEYVSLMANGLRVPSMEAVADARMPNEGQWQAFVLRTNAGWIDDNVARAPALAGALRRIPGLQAALVSTLGPRARLLPHRGPNKGVLRVHLGLVVPGAPGAALLRVGDQVAAFAEGRALVFDDTFEHAVENRADAARVTVMLEVERPLPDPVGRANAVLQRSFRWFPQVRGSAERLADLDLALNH